MFYNDPANPKVKRKDLNGVPEFILSRIPQPEGQPAELFTLLTDQSLMGDVIKNARSGALRRAMYLAGNSVAAENVQVCRYYLNQRMVGNPWIFVARRRGRWRGREAWAAISIGCTRVHASWPMGYKSLTRAKLKRKA